MNTLIAFLLIMSLLFVALTKFKISPSIALFLCAVLMALLCGFSVSDTVGYLAEGFGSVMSSIGLQIIFGGIFGMILGESGGMEEVAKAILRKIGKKNDILALNLASYFIFVPVFFDPAYITISPLAQSLQKYTGKRPTAYVAALFIGILTSHCLIPPSPGPLAVAEQLNGNIGWFIFYSILVSLPASLFCGWKLVPLLDRHKTTHSSEDAQKALILEEDLLLPDSSKPTVKLTLSLIIFPVVLLLSNCILGAILPAGNPVVTVLSFVGNPNIALFLSMLIAAIVLYKYIVSDTGESIWQYLDKAPASLGSFLVVIGCGNCFGTVLSHSGVGNELLTLLSRWNLPVILLAFLLTSLIRAAVGSGTVAMMTSAIIIAPTALAMGYSPIIMGLAVCTGAMTLTLPSDAAFWLPSKYNSLSVNDTIRAITLPSAVAGIITILNVVLLSQFAPFLPGLH